MKIAVAGTGYVGDLATKDLNFCSKSAHRYH